MALNSCHCRKLGGVETLDLMDVFHILCSLVLIQLSSYIIPREIILVNSEFSSESMRS